MPKTKEELSTLKQEYESLNNKLKELNEDELKEFGLDVTWKLPLADAPYGLSIDAVDEHAANGGTLIITVDCGISNFAEIHHANDLELRLLLQIIIILRKNYQKQSLL